MRQTERLLALILIIMVLLLGFSGLIIDNELDKFYDRLDKDRVYKQKSGITGDINVR